MFDHFGILAPYYERVIRLRDPHQLALRFGLPVTGALLDAGGGTGRVTQALHGLAGLLVVADLSEGMLRQAAQKNGLRNVCAPTERLPFPDETFERVIMVDAFHHVIDQPGTAREMWRVLRPGGRVIIEEPDIRTFTVKLIAVAEKLALMRSHFLSPAHIQALFPYPNMRATIESEGYNAWVIIEKDA